MRPLGRTVLYTAAATAERCGRATRQSARRLELLVFEVSSRLFDDGQPHHYRHLARAPCVLTDARCSHLLDREHLFCIRWFHLIAGCARGARARRVWPRRCSRMLAPLLIAACKGEPFSLSASGYRRRDIGRASIPVDSISVRYY